MHKQNEKIKYGNRVLRGDGWCGKFIKGDVIFGIVILFVNIIFGLIVGMMQQGMSFTDAALHYTQLTVGDGIVNQIGSLMLAISTGIIVTRVFDGSRIQ